MKPILEFLSSKTDFIIATAMIFLTVLMFTTFRSSAAENEVLIEPKETEILQQEQPQEVSAAEITVPDKQKVPPKVQTPTRLELNEEEWPFKENYVVRYEDYQSFITWFGVDKYVEADKSCYGIGFYIKPTTDRPVDIFKSPSFSSTFLGTIKPGKRALLFREQYQTSRYVDYGYYYVHNEGHFWYLIQTDESGEKTGWVAENETSILVDEYRLLYEINATGDVKDQVILDSRREDNYDDKYWIRESEFSFKHPEYSDSINWYGAFKGGLGHGFGVFVNLKKTAKRPVFLYSTPSYSAEIIGELKKDDTLTEWNELYQTEYTIAIGKYHVFKDDICWRYFEGKLSDTENTYEPKGWIACDEELLEFWGL